MDIKILTSVTLNFDERQDCLVIGTHGGIFHSDEVVGAAILCMLHKNEKIRIIRTRDIDILSDCDICVDVGGGPFDHHQKEFNLCRANGISYASAGLIWKNFGMQLTVKMLLEHFSEILNKGFDLMEIQSDAWKKIDEEVISLVDAEDNGMMLKENCFNYISSYLPLWFESNYDEKFMKVLEVTINVLEQKIVNTAQNCIAEIILTQRWIKMGNALALANGECTFADNILHIPSQTIPWVGTITKINTSWIPKSGEFDKLINFVIFPYPAGGWAAQCVPPSLEKKFDKRIPFPKEWAGQTDKLPEISGVNDATFCHNGCFFVRAKTKEGVIKMCKLAMEKN